MGEWKEYKVAEVIEEISMGPFGSNIKRDNYVDSGVPYLNGSNLSSYKLNEDSFNYVTEEKANSLGRSVAKRGDIIVTHRGTIGQISYIPNDSKYERYLTGNSQFRLTVNSKLIRPDFFVYYFHTRMGQYRLLANASQVGVPALARPTSTFKEVLVPVPKMEIQNKIMDILHSLDDKIEVNRRINDNLEQQAQALFKSWFVDFEPFREQPFVDSELGMIPKGWRVVELADIADISKVSINPQKNPQVSYKHYSIPSFDDGMKPEEQLGKDIKSNKFVITDKMTLFSKLNPRIKRVWFVDKLDNNSICSTEFVPYKAKEESKSSFVYGLINSQRFYDFVMSMVNGATGSHQRFHPEESLKFNISFKDECVSKYCEVITPMINQILDSREESRHLASLRDTLLPRLMSGEISVDGLKGQQAVSPGHRPGSTEHVSNKIAL